MGAISFDFNFWTLSLLLLNFALALFVAFTNRHKAAADELKAVKSSLHADINHVSQQVAVQGQRLAAIESDVENGISKNDLSAVHRRMDKVLETVGPLAGRLDEMSKNIRQIDEHFMVFLNNQVNRK